MRRLHPHSICRVVMRHEFVLAHDEGTGGVNSFGDEIQVRCGLAVIPSTLRQRQEYAQHHKANCACTTGVGHFLFCDVKEFFQRLSELNRFRVHSATCYLVRLRSSATKAKRIWIDHGPLHVDIGRVYVTVPGLFSAVDHWTKNALARTAVLECPASLCANLSLSFSELSFGLGAFVLNLSVQAEKAIRGNLNTSCFCGERVFWRWSIAEMSGHLPLKAERIGILRVANKLCFRFC